MISIIVPTYNAEAYLEGCLESIHQSVERLQRSGAQTVEIIVVDDGSETEVKGERLKVKGIRVIRQEHAGQSAARNRGLQAAQGEFIAFVDADDKLEPDWLERHWAAIRDADYVQSGYKRIKVKGERLMVKGERLMANGERLMANGERLMANGKTPWHRYQFTSPCMRLYRREAIEGLRFEEGMIYEDVIWSVDVWLRALRCRMIDYSGYLYTLNPQSTTSGKRPEAEQKVFAVLKERARNATRRGKRIILYTILRLKLHFLTR